MLEQSLLNSFGYFDTNTRKQKGSKLLAFQKSRALSPNTKKMNAIDHKYGGRPKEGQMVREGHYPKFSDMIDQIEKIALEYVKFETYLFSAKKSTI